LAARPPSPLMKSSALWVVLLLAAVARAEAPPIVVAPFESRCFDAAAVAERVRVQLPEARVSVGSVPPGAHLLLRLSAERARLTVQLSSRNPQHQIVGSDERILSLGGECESVLQTVALIVVRAVTPLGFRVAPLPPPRHPPRHPPDRARHPVAPPAPL